MWCVFFSHGKEITNQCANKLGVHGSRAKESPSEASKWFMSRLCIPLGRPGAGRLNEERKLSVSCQSWESGPYQRQLSLPRSAISTPLLPTSCQPHWCCKASQSTCLFIPLGFGVCRFLCLGRPPSPPFCIVVNPLRPRATISFSLYFSLIFPK